MSSELSTCTSTCPDLKHGNLKEQQAIVVRELDARGIGQSRCRAITPTPCGLHPFHETPYCPSHSIVRAARREDEGVRHEASLRCETCNQEIKWPISIGLRPLIWSFGPLKIGGPVQPNRLHAHRDGPGLGGRVPTGIGGCFWQNLEQMRRRAAGRRRRVRRTGQQALLEIDMGRRRQVHWLQH